MANESNTRNTTRLVAPINYMIRGDDDVLDIDTSGGVANLYIANIQQSGSLLQLKKIYINDITGNAQTNNIIVNTIDGDLINNLPQLVLNVNGISAEISIADRTRYLASLNSDGSGGGGGGGTVTGADNGLTLVGTVVKLGGSLLAPTVLVANNVNQFAITDDWGTVFKSRDADANFVLNSLGAPTLTASSFISSYFSDAGTTFINSTSAINFGQSCLFNNATDTHNFGDFTQLLNTLNTFSTGRNNQFSSTTDIFVSGSYNTVVNSFGIYVIGQGNTIANKGDKIFIGNNNNNLIVDTATGNILTAKTFADTTSFGTARIVGIDSLGKLFNTNVNPISITNLFNGGTCATDIYVSNIHSCSPLHIQPTNTGDVYIVENGGNVGIGTANPGNKLVVYDATMAGTTAIGIHSDTGNSALNLNAFISGYGTSGGGIINFNSNNTTYGNINTASANSTFLINSKNGYKLVLQDGTTSNVNINASFVIIFGNGAQNNFISTNSGDVGIGTNFLSPTAKLHIKGISSTSADYALKIDNSSNTPLLYVRNDGFTTIMNMIVGRGGGLIASNTVLGVSSLIVNSTGSGNVAVGFSTLSSNTTGSLNVAIGHNSSVNNTIGNSNVGVGYASNFSLIDGGGNIGIGSNANSSNQSGSHNIALGFNSLYTNTSNFNVGIGVFSGTNNLGTRNIFLGSYSGTNQTAVSNLLIIDNQDRGSAANELINSLIVGTFAGTAAGQYLRFNANVGIGVDATERLHVGGNALISGLAGVGNRTVLVDSTGKLIAGTAPTAGTSKYSTTFTPGVVNTANVITHSLGTTDIEVTLWDEANGEIFFGKVSNRTATTVSVTFTNNPVGNVRIVVIG